MGTYSLALTAQHFKAPVYVATESYNFVRAFPLGYGQQDLAKLGVLQDTLAGLDDDDDQQDGDTPASATTDKKRRRTETRHGQGQTVAGSATAAKGAEEMIELIPPELVEGLITENGIMTPTAVSEELIKLWF